MQIIDKYGYLDSALEYIEKYVISGRGLHKTAKKARINEDLFKNLSSVLVNFSEKEFLTLVQEKIEDRHSSMPGADIEVSQVDISIETNKEKAFILMNLTCDIVIDQENEDKIKLEVRIFSKNSIQIYIR